MCFMRMNRNWKVGLYKFKIDNENIYNLQQKNYKNFKKSNN